MMNQNKKNQEEDKKKENEEPKLDHYRLMGCKVYSKSFMGYSVKNGINLKERFDNTYEFLAFKKEGNSTSNRTEPLGVINPFYGLGNLDE